jgi:hypothetical protein
MGIYGGLEISGVVRMKFTFEGVKKKLKPVLEQLKDLFNVISSWKTYRQTISVTGTVAVPYMWVEWHIKTCTHSNGSGITLTDLVYTEDGNATYLPDGRINFGKQRLVSKLIRGLLQWQGLSYDFSISPIELSFTREFPLVEEFSLYNISLKREPRECCLKDLYVLSPSHLPPSNLPQGIVTALSSKKASPPNTW